jgi:hypothetical protein
MTAATAAFPRSQHWTVDGFRISVLLYKRNGYWENCAVCGARPAIHSVSATGRGHREGFRGGPARFCDRCRPAKGILPPLDYKRLVRGLGLLGEKPGDLIVYEHLATPEPHACVLCDEPALFECEQMCAGCDNPAAYGSIQRVGLRPGHVTEHPRQPVHTLHTETTWWACGEHAPAGSTPQEQP